MDKYRRLFNDTILFFLSNFGSKILTFLMVPLYTSVLSTKEYGTSDLINTTVSLLTPILTLSISDATLRFTLDKTLDSKKVLGNSLIILLASSLILAIGILFLDFFSNNNHIYYCFFAILFCSNNLLTILCNYIKGIGKTKIFAIQGILYTLVLMISNLFFLLVLKIGLNGYMLSFIVANIVSILFLCVTGEIFKLLVVTRIDRGLMRDMIKYSFPLIPATISWWIISSSDKYMISSLVSVEEMGIYSVSQKLPSMIAIITTIFTQAWQISAISNYGNKDESSFYSTIYKYYHLVLLISSIILIFFSKEIGKVLFLKDYFIAWKYGPILIISSIFSSYCSFLAAAFSSSKKTNKLLYSVLIGGLFNIIANYFLINHIGVFGAAISTMLSFMLMWFFRTISIRKLVDIKMNYITFFASYLLLIIGSLLITSEVIYAKYIFAIIGFIIMFMNLKLLKESKKQLTSILLNVLNKKSDNLK